jgi:uncharacterized protein (TIRG00374 family)
MSSRKIRLIINIVTIVALIVLLVVSWPQIQEGIKQMRGAKYSIIALMIPLQVLNFFAIGKLYQSYFKNQGYLLSTKLMLKVALELNFVNNIFPSGGVAGFSYIGVRMRKQGIPVATTTLAQGMRFILTFISFLILLFLGMFLLSFGSGTSGGGLALFIGLSIAFLTLFMTLFVFFIVSSDKRIKTFTAFLPKVLNSLFNKFNHKTNTINVSKIERLFGELHKDYVVISKDWGRLKKPFAWALVINLSEVATVYLAYIAIGQLVNPGAVILAYAVASFAGLIAIFPGGIGVYEALMTAVLASAGVPKALALSATLIYRIFTMMIFIPIGFVLYQLALRRGDVERPNYEPADGLIAN